MSVISIVVPIRSAATAVVPITPIMTGSASAAFSSRPDTAAIRYEDTVPAEVKRERLIHLQEEQRQIQTRKNAAWIGSTVEVLVEGFSRRTKNDVMGRTSSNHVVNFPGVPHWVGQLVTVQVVGSSPNSLYGEPSSDPV